MGGKHKDYLKLASLFKNALSIEGPTHILFLLKDYHPTDTQFTKTIKNAQKVIKYSPLAMANYREASILAIDLEK